MIKKKIIIVGAGLGGCFLAAHLQENFEITMVEVGEIKPLLKDRVIDVERLAVTYPHINSGLGGTTNLWHNGLMEISSDIFNKKWPYNKKTLNRYYEIAFSLLSRNTLAEIENSYLRLLEKYQAIGLHGNLFGKFLFYPKKRNNPWKNFNLTKKVKLITGEVIELLTLSGGSVDTLVYQKIKHGEKLRLTADIYVLAAGGLSTPLILQESNIMLKNAGCNYEDHPCATVGEIELKGPFYKLWNFPVRSGNLRLPFVVNQDGLQISFQLRPMGYSWVLSPTRRVKSILSDLRNNPFKISLYLKLVANFSDILEIISFKIGFNLPTSYYSIFMVAEQQSKNEKSVWKDFSGDSIDRKWRISEESINSYREALKKLISILNNRINNVKIYSNWEDDIFSSSHHSGTARMSSSKNEGVCDENLRVFGYSNLFVCDGSVIPASGVANTGLTIAALSIKLADYIKSNYSIR